MIDLHRIRAIPAMLAGALFLLLASAGLASPELAGESAALPDRVTTAVGETLFGDFVAPFELVGLLLLAALIGAIYLAKRGEGKREAVETAVREKPRIDASEAEESMGGE